MVRPRRTTRASASTSEAETARMKCVVWSTVVIGTIAAIGGEVGDHHRGVGKGHQRLARDRAAIAAQPLRERQAQDRARLPVGGIARRGKVEALDREIEIHHPGRKYLAKHAPGFRDAEFGCWWLLLHERPFPRLIVLPAYCSGHCGEGNSAGGPQIRREILRNGPRFGASGESTKGEALMLGGGGRAGGILAGNAKSASQRRAS